MSPGSNTSGGHSGGNCEFGAGSARLSVDAWLMQHRVRRLRRAPRATARRASGIALTRISMPNTSTGVNWSNTILMSAVENPQLKQARISLPTTGCRRRHRRVARRWRRSTMTSFSRGASHQDGKDKGEERDTVARSTRSNRDWLGIRGRLC